MGLISFQKHYTTARFIIVALYKAALMQSQVKMLSLSLKQKHASKLCSGRHMCCNGKQKRPRNGKIWSLFKDDTCNIFNILFAIPSDFTRAHKLYISPLKSQWIVISDIFYILSEMGYTRLKWINENKNLEQGQGLGSIQQLLIGWRQSLQ